MAKGKDWRAENWGGDPEGPLAKALDKARSADPTPPLVIESLDDWGDSQCSSCGTFDEVHECWNCDKQLCIDCDPGEMRSDLDGHTYCDNCGPNNGKKSPIKDQNSESFALEQRDDRRCPNCHGNLYAKGCNHHGIMPHPIMRAAEDQPCYICEKDQWTHQGVDTTYAVCDSCKASFVCRQCGSSKVDTPGRLSPTTGYAYPTAQCHDCGAVWNPHKEGVSSTRLHSREESDSLLGKKLGGVVSRVTMGQRRRLDPRSGVEVPNEPSHYCACGNPLFIYPLWDLPESRRLGRESLKAECKKCGWEGVVQRHDTSQGDLPKSFEAPGATTFSHLFKKATTGKIQEWRIRTEELPGGNWAYISSHGQLGGSMVEGNGVVIKAGKQGRTVEEQANAEAASKWKKKRDSGYFETADEAENNLVLLPMLALDHKKRGHNIEWPAIGQPKLDGIRCLARLDSDGNISLTSRKNKPFPGMDHIRDELATRLKDLSKSVGDPFPNDIVIDGELYADPNELTFQQVTGLVRRDNKKPEDIENEKKLKLNVYDSINVNDLEMDFIDRHDLVSNNLRGMDSITIVENTPLADPDAVDPIHDQFVREGYEGLIIRNIKGPYKLNGRSKHLQKYKSFQDDEYEIVGYEEGKGNYEGTVIWVCETPEGKRFKIKPNGTHEQRSTWFDNADSYIGHRITVRFFELTDDGIPRFPTGGWFRNYEAEEWDLDQCAFCDHAIYDEDDSTEFEDEQYHDVCLSHWLHMDAESETFEAPVTCEICGKTFDSFRGLNGHMNAHLPKRAEEESESNNNVVILIGVLCGSALMAFISSKLK